VLTDRVAEFVGQTGIRNGQVLVHFMHTTGAIIINEYDVGILTDMLDMFERLAPTDYPYKHHRREVDYNGHAHLRLALMQPNVTVPLVNGRLGLGTYQDILVIDDQVEQSPRYVIVQVMGE
jgi:secondary thiamine-phosphate synthase enzyme